MRFFFKIFEIFSKKNPKFHNKLQSIGKDNSKNQTVLGELKISTQLLELLNIERSKIDGYKEQIEVKDYQIQMLNS